MTEICKRALITGVTGQDGSYLSAFLLERGYDVHGVRLYAASDDTERLKKLVHHPRFHLHYGDLTDGGAISRLIYEIRPHEIYNLAAQSHVQVSFQTPEATANINALGILRILESVRTLEMENLVRVYQASSSEMFGNMPAPQSEATPFQPCSPYGVSKLYAYWTARNYRETYGMHVSNGILFNHESPLRGEEFVTRKVTRSVAAIADGHMDFLSVGNLESRRDWGHARDYVEGMWRMLQQPEGGDYVLATGKAHSVRDLIEAAFACTGISLCWEGQGGRDVKTGRCLVKIDPQFFRPKELHELIGDARKAKEALGWEPRTNFRDMVAEMVDADRTYLKQNDYDENWLLAAE